MLLVNLGLLWLESIDRWRCQVNMYDDLGDFTPLAMTRR